MQESLWKMLQVRQDDEWKVGRVLTWMEIKRKEEGENKWGEEEEVKVREGLRQVGFYTQNKKGGAKE